MAERYGQASSASKLFGLVAVVLVVCVALAWLGWAAWNHSSPEVTGRVHSYDVVSPHEIDVTLDVYRPDGDAVTCTLRAQAPDHSIVGERTVRLPAGASGEKTIKATLKTDREATTATVVDCR
ncbi:MAG: DUF4307 domain-containing protein [Nocardioidaceae bacterium]